MPETDVKAEPSPATAEQPREIADLFYKTLPQADSTPAKPSASTPEQPDVQEEPSPSPESEETAPDSEPGTTETEKEPPKPGRDKTGKFVKHTGAASRIEELLAENRNLRQQLEVRQSSPPAAPAKVEPEKPNGEAPLDPANLTWEQFQEWQQKQIAEATKRAFEEQAKQVGLTKAREAWNAQVQEATKQHADFKTQVYGTNGQLKVAVHPVFDVLIPQSPLGAEILYHLATNPDLADEIQALQNPYEAGARFYQLRDELQQAKEVPTPPPPKRNLRPPATVSGTHTRPKERTMAEVFYGKS